MKNIEKYINTAMGREDADLILKGGSVVDVFTGTVKRADVIIKDGVICGVGSYSGKNEVDVSGNYIVPSFVDAHVHIESSMVTPAEYAKAVIPHGVTTIIADPHEITNVCGEDGLNYMLEASESIPLDVKLMLPSCVPAAPFEHSGAVLTAEDTQRIADKFFGIGEMMNYPGILASDSETLGKLCLDKIDGHAPLLSGNKLDAYASAGIKTDHECGIVSEMEEKISKGMYVLLREGTLSHDVEKLTGGINPYTLRRCAFCTDDRFVGDIINHNGSIENCMLKAQKTGVSFVDTVIMATLNACELYGIKDRGAIAPSYAADIVVMDSESFHIRQVYKDGTLVAENYKPLFNCKNADTSKVTGTVHLPEITSDFFADDMKDEFEAIELIPESIVTKKVTAKKGDKLSKVCVIERHHNLGTRGIGYVTNYGITGGAIATSIGHDSHNVIVIGDNDADMALAVNTLGKSGGIAVCGGGKVMEYLELEIAGLMTDKNAREVTLTHDRLEAAARGLHVTFDVDPFLSLAFLPLPVIPEIRITDSGLFDVIRFAFI